MNKSFKNAAVVHIYTFNLNTGKNKINEIDICINDSNYDAKKLKTKDIQKIVSSYIKRPSSNAAITLIALIITIIVLLILAGVTLNMVMGDSGIFNKAHIAKEKTRNAENDEKIKLAVLASKDKDGNIDNNKFEKELEEYGITDYTKDEENVIIKIDNIKYTVSNNGNIIKEENYNASDNISDEEATKVPVFNEKDDNIIYSSFDSNTYSPFKAFDNDDKTAWLSAEPQEEEYLGYDFKKMVIPYKVELVNYSLGGYRCKNFIIEGQEKNSEEWIKLTDKQELQPNSELQTFVTNNKKVEKVRIKIFDIYGGTGNSRGVARFQVYCK